MYEVAMQTKADFRPFSDLAVVDPVEDLRGGLVQDALAEVVGYVEELYLDLYTLQPQYALIRTQSAPAGRIRLPQRFLYPLDLIRTPAYGSCFLSHAREQLADFEEFAEVEAQSHDGFRLISLSDAEDERVWQLGDSLPFLTA